MTAAPDARNDQPTIARTTLEVDGLRRGILVLRSEAPECVAVIMDDANGSLDARLVMDLDQRPLEELARAILGAASADPDQADPDRPGVPPLMAQGMQPEMLRAAIAGGSCQGYSAEQCAALLDFLQERVPMRALEWLGHDAGMIRSDRRRLGWSTVDWLRFFSEGDAEARAQAFWSLPTICREIPSSMELLAAIDRREEIYPALVRKVRMVIDQEISPFSASGMTGGLAQAPSIVKLRGPNWDPTPGVREMPGIADVDLDRLSRSIARKMLKIDRILARSIQTGRDLEVWSEAKDRNNLTRMTNMLSIVRMDQIPDSVEDIDAMQEAMTAAGMAAYTMQISFAPMLRVMSRVTRTGWKDAGLELGSTASQTLIRDFVRSTASRISSSIVVDRMTRSVGAETMTRIMKAAEAIWAREDVPETDARMSKAFFKFCASWGPASSLLQELRPALAQLISERVSLKTLEELQVRWHHINQRIENQVMADSGEMTWSPLIGTVDLPNGLKAVELTSSGRLAEQGRRERHCVGGYAPRILSSTDGQMRTVFSIEDKRGDILSTAEIIGKMVKGKSGRMTGAIWDIAEHRSKGNSSPGPRATYAVRALVDTLNDLPAPVSKAYARMLATNPSSLLDALQGAVATFGLNPTNPDIPRISLEAVDDVLPRHLRGRGVEDWAQDAARWIEFSGASDLVKRRHVSRFEEGLVLLAEELGSLAANDRSQASCRTEDRTEDMDHRDADEVSPAL